MSNKPLNLNVWTLLTRVFKSHNLEPYKAIAELVDNSTVAVQGIRNPGISIEYFLEERKLIIRDNGVGFDKFSREESKNYGRVKALDGRNKYNVGMKNAMYWLGNVVTIDSFDSKEEKSYSFNVKLNPNIEGSIDFQDWHESNEERKITVGTRITIEDIRPIVASYKDFVNNIINQLRFMYNRDLLAGKFNFTFSFRENINSNKIIEEIKPLDLKYETDQEGFVFHRDFEPFKIENIKYKYSFKVQTRKTKNRTKYGGINFYYKDRFIYKYPIRKINSELYAYQRTLIDVDIVEGDVNLSYSKDAILSEHSDLIIDIREKFNEVVVPFFKTLDDEKQSIKSVTKEKTKGITGAEKIIYSDNSGESKFEYKFEVIQIVDDENSIQSAEFEKVEDNSFIIKQYQFFNFKQTEQLIIACLLEFNKDIDVIETIKNGEIS